ncbi:MAG TPA: MoaD/ThiS family protein, partial [Mycobacterium sp.]|nr:MoaD/ThiS family protein [Mycobacterium sp.]
MTVQLTVRYFAAARAAAGTESETLRVEHGTTVAGLV